MDLIVALGLWAQFQRAEHLGEDLVRHISLLAEAEEAHARSHVVRRSLRHGMATDMTALVSRSEYVAITGAHGAWRSDNVAANYA